MPALYDVSWSLRSGETTSWADAQLALLAFSVGRWECALGEVQSDDTLGPAALYVRRTRRLACTHATGATVQTQLQCAIHIARTSEQQPQPAPDDEARELSLQRHERELSLQLDTAPTLHLRCAPQPVAQLALVGRDKRPLASVCATPGSLAACEFSPTPPLEHAAQPATSALPKP